MKLFGFSFSSFFTETNLGFLLPAKARRHLGIIAPSFICSSVCYPLFLCGRASADLFLGALLLQGKVHSWDWDSHWYNVENMYYYTIAQTPQLYSL